MVKHVFFYITFLICSLSNATDARLSQGITAFNSKEYAKALAVFTPLAKETNSSKWRRTAQYYLGGMYSIAAGVEYDANEMIFWYKKAAVNGHVVAMIDLSNFYLTGEGVEQSNEKTLFWLKAAIEQGESALIESIPYMSHHKLADNIDRRKLFDWWLSMASKHNAFAQYAVGMMYHEGDFIEQSFERSASWYGKAALKGDSTAQNNLAALYGKGLGVKKNEKIAAYWYEQAAKLGQENAQNNIGLYLLEGKVVEKDLAKAEYWLRQSAEQGYQPAIENLELFLSEK